ncbi:hypothetical protein D3C76_1714520 [compost metagenome]
MLLQLLRRYPIQLGQIRLVMGAYNQFTGIHGAEMQSVKLTQLFRVDGNETKVCLVVSDIFDNLHGTFLFNGNVQ